MKNFKNFDSFDGEIEVYSFDNENSILQRLAKDYGIGLEGLKNLLSTYFPRWYNSSFSLSENVDMIYNNLKEKQNSGEELTSLERILINSIEKAKREIDKLRQEQVKKAIFENLPIVLIVIAAIVFITKKVVKK